MPWRALAYRAARPLLFRFEPECIHRLTIKLLRLAGENGLGRAVAGFAGGATQPAEPAEVAGVRFRNRVGVGAGFDKDGSSLRGWAAMGLGFAEVGTVTPLPQEGNPRPRLFRLSADEALINRLGFNNAGAAALARNVMLARRYLPDGFVVGVNIGRNRETPDERSVDDYLTAHRLVAPIADYLAVNVSSPNTPGLRLLQAPDRLRELLDALHESGQRLDCPRPLFVKLAPDASPAEMEAMLAALLDGPAAGVILANSTLARDGLAAPPALAEQAGGLSGRPLLPRTVAAVAHARGVVGQRLAIIASGGIGTGADAAALREAGADLVQLWTGLVYRGPGLVGEAVRAS
jgi:dihydroorotate dehydrogenase